jgi:hypothetical protein
MSQTLDALVRREAEVARDHRPTEMGDFDICAFNL